MYMQGDLATIYDTAKTAAVKGARELRVPIHKDLKLHEWRARHTGLGDDAWIIDALQYGFPLQYAGPFIFAQSTTYNHPSATSHPDTIREYIAKETKLGALHGPYPEPRLCPGQS